MEREADEYPDKGTGPGPGRGRFSLRNLGTFASFKNPVFRLYFLGMVGMMSAMNMQLMVRSLLVYRLTGSAALLGGVALAYSGPTLFTAFFGGVIADRVQKKYLILVGLAGSALVALGVALTLTLGYLSAERVGSWWILVAAALAQGAMNGFMMPARQAILPEIIGREGLLNAVSLSSLEMNALRLLAPAAAGFLIDAFDFATVFYLMAGLDLMGVLFVSLLPRTSIITIRGGALTSIKQGFHYIRRNTIVLFVLLSTLGTILLFMPYQWLLPLFTEDILKVGASGIGVLMSVSGIGAVVVSLIFASLPNKRRGLLMLASSLLLGIALTAFSFSSSWPLSLGLMFFVGLGQGGQAAMSNTLLQYYTEAEYLGRVMSVISMWSSLGSLTAFVAGLLAETLGAQWAIGGFAIVLIFVIILTLVFVPRLRRLD